MFVDRIKFSLIGVVVSLSVFFIGQNIQLPTVDVGIPAFHMVIVFLILVLQGAVADWVVYRLNKKAEKERLEIYRATVWASHHVLNNFLNKLYLIQYRASENGEFTEEMSETMGKMIQEAAGQLMELSRVEPITAEGIRESVAPK